MSQRFWLQRASFKASSAWIRSATPCWSEPEKSPLSRNHRGRPSEAESRGKARLDPTLADINHRKHFFGSAQPALDRAVHIALPLCARVFPGKEYAIPRPPQQMPRRRRKGVVEECVRATRPAIVFPGDTARSDEPSATKTKKAQ